MNVNEKDFLAKMVAAVKGILARIDFSEYLSERSNRIFSDRWKFVLLVFKEWMGFTYEKLSAQLSSFPEILRLGTPKGYRTRIPSGSSPNVSPRALSTGSSARPQDAFTAPT